MLREDPDQVEQVWAETVPVLSPRRSGEGRCGAVAVQSRWDSQGFQGVPQGPTWLGRAIPRSPAGCLSELHPTNRPSLRAGLLGVRCSRRCTRVGVGAHLAGQKGVEQPGRFALRAWHQLAVPVEGDRDVLGP